MTPLDEAAQVEQHAPLVRHIAKRYGGDPDEVFAAGLEGLWNGVRGYDPAKGKFSTYAGHCIRSSILDQVSNSDGVKRYRGKGIPPRRFCDYAMDPDASYRDRTLTRYEDREEVEHHLAKLRPRYRLVVVLRLLDGLSSAEVAERLGYSVYTVHTMLACALAGLRGSPTGACALKRKDAA